MVRIKRNFLMNLLKSMFCINNTCVVATDMYIVILSMFESTIILCVSQMLHVRFLDIIFIKFLRKLNDFMETILYKKR